MIRCIAIDDEPLALGVIRKYASETPLLDLLDTFTDAFQALTFLKTHQTDLLFLDIQMPDISGIQLFQSLKSKPRVIFTTAHPQYAVKGFELEAVDYLMKPIKFDRFLRAVAKVDKLLGAQSEIRKEEFIFVKSGYQSVRINLDEIIFIEGLDDYIKFHLSNPRNPLILSLMSMKAILRTLPERQFMRVHRSFIVPVNRITGIRSRMVYLDSVKVPVGDSYAGVVQSWISGHR
jgi:DNA-binding LytR/AlgR family response regulator